MRSSGAGAIGSATLAVAMPFVMNQKEIDRRTFEVAPHLVASPQHCDVCDSAEVYKLVSREVIRGRLLVVTDPTPEFDASASLAFCADCWPRWLMWRARMGFDLHTHSASAPCTASCLARRQGRYAQFVSQMSLMQDPNQLFFAQKQIDGQPRANGSPLIMAQRAGYFMLRQVQRQWYYESIGDAAEVRRQFIESAILMNMGAARAANSHLIVVQAFESWYTAPGGAVSLPKAGDRSIGLHCVHLTGYLDHGETLGFANSWGRGWGDRGFGTRRSSTCRPTSTRPSSCVGPDSIPQAGSSLAAQIRRHRRSYGVVRVSRPPAAGSDYG
jgi:hypothetical protein